MHHKGPQTGQKEKNKARNQDLAKPCGWPEHCRTLGCRPRPSFKNSESSHRVRRQRRLQGAVSTIHRLRRPILHVRASQGFLLCLISCYPLLTGSFFRHWTSAIREESCIEM